ncbi:ABC transporter permease [Roseitranquillus sediminis]|uniref:ABC transporter permease n=1 Tax=Roseitranquillus sediminis TaxID=2809051 RepID=UPI002223AFC3|nr:ABC transporter permease [Roseitranquillus sediminis]
MWRREVLRYVRDTSQLFGGISRTILWLVILGLGLGAALREIEGYTYAQFILPGVITLNVLFASMQCAIALIWDRQVGLLREVVISPAPMLSVALGKLLGGATIALVQGIIPFLFTPLIGVEVTLAAFLLALVVIFSMGITLTGAGIVLASRLRTFEGFGAISNGVIQPLYFLSGSIFPLRGVVGGVGFLDIPEHLRVELRQLGIYAIGGGWVVQLPVWLQVLVYANPVSYMLDTLRFVLLDFRQLPLALDLGVILLSPPLAVIASAHAMKRMTTSR